MQLPSCSTCCQCVWVVARAFLYLLSDHFTFDSEWLFGCCYAVSKVFWQVARALLYLYFILYFSLVFCSLDVAHVRHSFIVQQVWMCAGCQSVYIVWCECLTSAVWAHSPVQAGAAAPSVWHHRCPPISCGDALRERWPHASTPSAGGGGGTAWGQQKTASLFPIYCCVNIATIFNCIHCCTKLQWSIVLSWWYWQPWIDIRFEICVLLFKCMCVCVCVSSLLRSTVV